MIRSPFFTTNNYEGLKIHIRLDSLLLITGLFEVFLLTISIISSCASKFDCTEFLPTISYLASYSYYDRFINFALSCLIFPLLIFFISAYTEYKHHLSRLDSFTLLMISLIFSIFLPSILIVDEVYTSFHFPLDKLHVIFLSFLTVFICIWILFSLEWVYKIYEKTRNENAKIILGYVIACLISLFITVYYWKVSDSAWTYNKLAISEYLTTTLFLFLPRIYCLVLQDIIISLDRGKVIHRDKD